MVKLTKTSKVALRARTVAALRPFMLGVMRKIMNTKVRTLLAVILGAGIAVFVWYQIAMLHPNFHRFGVTSLVPPTVASLLGGFIVAYIAPNHKVGLSAFVGFIVSAPMLFYLLHNGFSHHGRNPFIWYWPFYVMPCFCFGGYLGGSAWRHA